MTELETVKDGIKHCSIDHDCCGCPFRDDSDYSEETCITRLQRMAYNVICDLEERMKE